MTTTALGITGSAPEESLSPVPKEQGTFRVAMAQIETRAANIPFNLESALRAIDRAEKEGADLVVLPEMHLAGYFSLDKFENPRFLAACERALNVLVEYTKGKNVAVAVGYPRVNHAQGHVGEKPFNSIAIVENATIVHTVDKRLMAGNTRDLGQGDIFWDDRYFQPGSAIETFTLKGRKVALCVCEDLFFEDHDKNVPATLLAQKPDVLIIPSASPGNVGKFNVRLNLLKPLAREYGTEIVYVNAVGTYDGYEGEVAVDGRSLVMGADGEIHALGKAYSEDFLVYDLKQKSPVIAPICDEIADIHDALIQGIRSYFKRNGFSKAVIGSSGGIDSAIVKALAVEALGAENVIAVTMPSHITSGETLSDAQQLSVNLGVRCDVRPIGPMYQAWLEGRRAAGLPESGRITKQNIQARMRLQILMEYCNEIPGALLLNTTNKTEAFLGYGTLYADLGGAIGPLMDVNKMRVYELSEDFNRRWGSAVIPASILERAPSAELEEGQTDEANLPAAYPILAPLVDLIVEKHPSPTQLATWLCEKFELSQDSALRIVVGTLKLIDAAEHKRRQVPPGERVTEKAAGAGRRMPLSRDAFNELTVYDRLAEMEKQGMVTASQRNQDELWLTAS